jgi:hypothetical protein
MQATKFSTDKDGLHVVIYPGDNKSADLILMDDRAAVAVAHAQGFVGDWASIRRPRRSVESLSPGKPAVPWP